MILTDQCYLYVVVTKCTEVINHIKELFLLYNLLQLLALLKNRAITFNMFYKWFDTEFAIPIPIATIHDSDVWPLSQSKQWNYLATEKTIATKYKIFPFCLTQQEHIEEQIKHAIDRSRIHDQLFGARNSWTTWLSALQTTECAIVSCVASLYVRRGEGSKINIETNK